MADPRRAMAILERLRGLGVKLSLDDLTGVLVLRRGPSLAPGLPSALIPPGPFRTSSTSRCSFVPRLIIVPGIT